MNKARLERIFSQERLKPYYVAGADYEDAVRLYKLNIRVSETFYVSLSILEVALRNAIHSTCKQYFNDDFWFKNCLPADLSKEVHAVELKMLAAKKIPTADRIVSELTFGFWTTLFNRKYAQILWKPLHQIFRHAPRHLRQRAHISPILNAVRDFRNRVYHYEPLIWNMVVVQKKHQSIVEILHWIDADLVNWFSDIDKAPDLIESCLQRK